ncbi:MAG: response regulator [bacterium]
MNKGKKVLLVVDDNIGIIESMDMLFCDDFEVLAATSVTEAMNILGKVQPDIILLDYLMPGLNGIQLLREIKQMKIASKIILFTASVWESVREEVMDLGVDGFIRKPFDIWEIEALARGTAPAA